MQDHISTRINTNKPWIMLIKAKIKLVNLLIIKCWVTDKKLKHFLINSKKTSKNSTQIMIKECLKKEKQVF